MNITQAIQTLQKLPTWLTNVQNKVDNLSSEKLQFIEAEQVILDSVAYRQLSSEDAHSLAYYAIEFFDAGLTPDKNEGEFGFIPYYILKNIAEIVSGSLDGLHGQLLQRGLGLRIGEGIFLREADPLTRDQLIARLQALPSKASQSDYLLTALAWIGDDIVQHHFVSWREQHPTWLPLNFSLTQNLLAAGWELTEDGHRRDLYWQTCYDIIPTTQNRVIQSPLEVGVVQEERCGWCSRPLTVLFDLDLRDPSFARLEIDGERLRIPLCLNCSFECVYIEKHVYADIDTQGTARWCEINGETPPSLGIWDEGDSEYIPPFPEKRYVLGEARPTPYERWGSHIGGCPGWEQYSEYPICPVCQQTMLFLGQFQPLVGSLEGLIYAFVCLPCGKSTTVYQQS